MPMTILDITGRTQPAPTSAAVNRIGKVLASLFGVSGANPVPNVKDRQLDTERPETSAAAVDLTSLWKIYTDRKRTVLDIDTMDQQDGIISMALDIIADHATAYTDDINYRPGEAPGKVRKINKGAETGFRVVSDDPETQKILDDLITRLGLADPTQPAHIWQLVRKFVKYGTYLPEVVLDDDEKTIIALNETAAHEVWPKENIKGHKVKGWIYRRDKDIYNSTSAATGGEVTAGIEMGEWQILPFYFGPRKGFWTQSFLMPIRYPWKRLQRLEDNMAVQRLKGVDRYVYKVPVSPNMNTKEVIKTIQTFMKSITKRDVLGPNQTLASTDNPMDAFTDIFLPAYQDNPGGVDLLSPSNAHLSNLTDIYYQRETILARLGVPITYLQIMSTQKTHLTAAAGLNGIEKQFAKYLHRVQDTLAHTLARLFNMQLLLMGVTPTPGLYTIELPLITTKDALNDAKVNLTNSQAAVFFSEAFGALPMEIMSEMFMNLTIEQQGIMADFASKWDKRVTTAKVKALEMAATKPAGPAGNASKPRAGRVTEQIGGGGSQSLSLDKTVDLFMELQTQMEKAFEARGIPLESDDLHTAETVRTSLEAFARHDDASF